MALIPKLFSGGFPREDWCVWKNDSAVNEPRVAETEPVLCVSRPGWRSDHRD